MVLSPIGAELRGRTALVTGAGAADGIGFADLSLGGTFPHRIAVNVWQGIGAPQAPEGTAGMRYFELDDPRGGEVRELADPAGNRLIIRPAA